MNIIAYRLPGDTEQFIYQAKVSDGPTSGKGSKRFVVAPFDPSKAPVFYSLGRRMHHIPIQILSDNDAGYRFVESSKADYSNYINSIKCFISGDEQRKVVASRRKILGVSVEADALFQKICKTYPDAFVFFISTAEFGTWIGASPELLLESETDVFSTVALAGTRRADSEGDWDRKNLLEQAIVTRHIKEIMEDAGLTVKLESSRTHRAGPIEHIMTPVRGEGNAEPFRLLKELSPTPALAGYPRDEAIRIIREHEGDRVLYGGFCGPIHANGDFRMQVILRCAFIQPDSVTLFAGGGITCHSEPEAEWEETENKFQTLSSLLGS